MFSKKQGQRLIPEYLLKYTEKLNENHPDPSASWGGGGSGSYIAGDGIDITNDVISIDDTVALKEDIPDTTNFVTTNTNQTISGIKTLEGNANNVILKIDDTTPSSYDQLKFTPENMIVQGNFGATTSYGKDGVVVSGQSNEFEITYLGTNKTYTFDDSKGGTVATTDEIITSYNDLTDKPTIPDISNYYDKDEVDALISNVESDIINNVDYTNDTLVLTDGTNNFEVSEPLVVEQKTNTITWTGFYKYNCYWDIVNLPSGLRLVDDNGVDITTLNVEYYSASGDANVTSSLLYISGYSRYVDLEVDRPYYMTDGVNRALVNSITLSPATTLTIWYDTSGIIIGGTTRTALSVGTDVTLRFDSAIPFDTTSLTSGNTIYYNCIELTNTGTNTNSRLMFKGFQTSSSATSFILDSAKILVYTNDGSTPITNATITNYTNTSPYATMSDGFTFNNRKYYTNYSSYTIANRSIVEPIPNEYKITCNIPKIPTIDVLGSNTVSLSTTSESLTFTGTMSDYDRVEVILSKTGSPNISFNLLPKLQSTLSGGTLHSPNISIGTSYARDYIDLGANISNNTLSIKSNTTNYGTTYYMIIGYKY